MLSHKMVETTKKALTRYCFVVRHGERADQSPELKSTVTNSADPVLTPVGHRQATVTGQFLKDRLDEI